MQEEIGASIATSRPSDTQIGAITECLVASHIIAESRGRLAPFRPFADDDGIDLLVFDKLTGLAIPLQVKARTGADGVQGQTVQFDVRTKTFAERPHMHLLAVLFDLNAMRFSCSWLMPFGALKTVAISRPDKLMIRPSPRDGTKDRYAPYRCGQLSEVVQRLINALQGA